MTSVPQTRQRALAAQEGRRRAIPVAVEDPAPARARQSPPAVDPSTVFGCVDWFLYPDQAVGRSVTETQAIPA